MTNHPTLTAIPCPLVAAIALLEGLTPKGFYLPGSAKDKLKNAAAYLRAQLEGLPTETTITTASGWVVTVYPGVPLPVAQAIADSLDMSVDYITPENVATLAKMAVQPPSTRYLESGPTFPMPLNLDSLSRFEDGTWILTEGALIVDSEHWRAPKPAHVPGSLWWRKKQLIDHLQASY